MLKKVTHPSCPPSYNVPSHMMKHWRKIAYPCTNIRNLLQHNSTRVTLDEGMLPVACSISCFFFYVLSSKVLFDSPRTTELP